MFVAVTNTETATKVDMLDIYSFSLQPINKDKHPVQGIPVRREIGQLGTDMTGYTLDADSGMLRCTAVDFESLVRGKAKLVFEQAGRNIGVRFGVYVRVYPLR